MSRKLLTEIDKTLKDARNTTDAYDEKWNELRMFNRTQVGVKEKVLEESRREQMRGKKHAVRTATLELLDFKHACDSKAKIESDMESILRRLHRFRQQLTEWLGCSELRTQCDELKDLRKQIELRYKRGRVFYCLGQSSEDTLTGDTGESNPDGVWIAEFIEKLKIQTELWEADVESIAKQMNGEKLNGSKDNGLSDKRAQLEAFVDLHKMHIRRLEAILRAVRNHDYVLPESSKEEIFEPLRSYLDENQDLTIVVADEIYHDIDVPIYESSGEESPITTSSAERSISCSESVKSPCNIEDSRTSTRSPNIPAFEGGSPELSQTQHGDPIEVAFHKHNELASNKYPMVFAGASPSSEKTTTKEFGTSINYGQATSEDSTASTTAAVGGGSSSDLMTSPWTTNNESSAVVAHTVIAEDAAVCDWTYEGRGNEGDAMTSNKTLKLRRGDRLLIIKIDSSGWTFGYVDDGLLTSPGVKSLSVEDIRNLRSGWFPDCVRALKKKKDKAAAAVKQRIGGKTKVDEVWEIGGSSGPKPTQSLLERLNIVDSNYQPINKLNAADVREGFLDVIERSTWWWRALTTVTLGTISIVRWSWSGEFLRDCKCEVSFLDRSDWGSEERACGSRHNIINVKAGDRVFIESINPEQSWVFGKVVGDDISGWFPGYVLVDVNDLLDRLVRQTNTLLDSSSV